MIVLGLTGSIGMGKSAVTAMFRAQGVPVFDADAEVHRLQGSGGGLVTVIEARFPGTTGPGGVDRQKLGAQVLGHPADLKALERIIHPAVYKARQMFLRRNRSRALVVLDIPLLFEKRGLARLDAIVTVSAPLWMQRRRVLARANMTLTKFNRINALQLPDHHKRARADFVIETGCLRLETRQAVRRLIACLMRKKGG